MTDSMIPIAIIYSRSEAIVVASLLDANGILCHIGGYNHASVEFYQVALGGFRLTVPEFQHAQASAVILETPGFGEVTFSYALQRAVIKFATIWMCLFGLAVLIKISVDQEELVRDLALIPLSALGIPANPQGFSRYILSSGSKP